MILDAMIGKKVEAVKPVHDYVQIVFDGDSRFTILNRYAGDISSITGSTVVSVVDDKQGLEIQFSNGMTIWVGLREDDCRGPEAFRFYDRAVGPNFFVVELNGHIPRSENH